VVSAKLSSSSRAATQPGITGPTIADSDHTEGNASIDRQKESTALRALRCHPEYWRHFSYEKTSKASKFREVLVYNLVNLSIPANRNQRDVAEQIAKKAHIPIESLPNELDQIVSWRGQTLFGFASDLFDQIADYMDNMKWWVSDHGLEMAIVTLQIRAEFRLWRNFWTNGCSTSPVYRDSSDQNRSFLAKWRTARG
jgi:hypothetical protein